MSKYTLIIVLFIYSIVVSGQNANTPVALKIEKGTIEGFHDSKSGLNLFLGIPFAKPPVGDLRWKAPQPIDRWNGLLQTKQFGSGPYQHNVFGDMVYRSKDFSEDCLYLNVWAPVQKTPTALPVLVYFYGGGFVAGDGSERRYDGASMATKGIVTVTVNYRLNIFGFFAHPELTKEASYHGSGNYGLLDQHAALEWVQKNIAFFGGDPKRVTIAGESAGSISVSAQMASPLSKGLVAAAIGESGASIRPTLYPISMSEAEKQGLEFATKTGYPAISQLRALSPEELYKLYTESKRFGFPLAIDGYFFPKSLVDIFKAKEQAQIPLLVGWNSAESSGKGFMKGMPYTEANYVKNVKETYREKADEVLKLYPYGSEKEIERSATDLTSDNFIVYSTWKWFDLHRKNSAQPVYRYLYNKIRPRRVEHVNAPKTPDPPGAGHSWEIEYCMGNLDSCRQYAWTPDDYTVSSTMQNYFANFIIHGNPNGAGLPQWPPSAPGDSNPPVMIIDIQSKIVKAKDDARYIFLDGIYGNN